MVPVPVTVTGLFPSTNSSSGSRYEPEAKFHTLPLPNVTVSPELDVTLTSGTTLFLLFASVMVEVPDMALVMTVGDIWYLYG